MSQKTKDILMCYSNTLESFHSSHINNDAFQNFSNEFIDIILNSNDLPETDKVIILVTLTVGKYSFAFNTNY